MKLAIVSAYPPSKTTLNEYGFYLTNHFEEKEEISDLFLFHDITEEPLDIPERHSRIQAFPCWRFDSPLNFINITKQALKNKPDIVFINMQFLQFGSNKVSAALGLMTPWLLRLFGFKVVVLLHNITETVDYAKAGITTNKILSSIFDQFGNFLSKLILKADLVCLTMKSYTDIYRKKYKAGNVAMIPHGAFETPNLPDFIPSQEKYSIMTFGKFGTYKKVEPLIEAVEMLSKKVDKPIELVIAGTDNPNVPGYLDEVQKKYSHIPDIQYTGYVEESDVPKLFGDSTLVVFPYTTTTGSSGVLHQASSYGRAAILPDIDDLATLVKEEGYTGQYFVPENAESLAEAILELLENEEKREAIARQNYFAAISVPMTDICTWYMHHFRNILNKSNRASNKKPTATSIATA